MSDLTKVLSNKLPKKLAKKPTAAKSKSIESKQPASKKAPMAKAASKAAMKPMAKPSALAKTATAVKATAKAVPKMAQKPVAVEAAPLKAAAPKMTAPKVAPIATPVVKAAPVVAAAIPESTPVPIQMPEEAPAVVVPPPPPVVNAIFNVGDNAVYPGHGVGKVTAIESKEIFGKKHEFYSIQILENGMKIMIPKDNVASVGLRPIISRDEAAKVISILRETNVKIDNQTWNRRYREYMEKIKTGSVFEIAEVLRDLFLLKVDKELSFGERKMLDTARGLLLKELSLATSREELAGQDEVAAIFGLQGT
jgi:CarD family transcriptional regulator